MSDFDDISEQNSELSGQATFRAREGLVAESIEGDTVILDLDGDEYFTLNEVAGAIWALLEEGASIDELVEDVTDQYEVDSDRARNDVREFLAGALEAGIVERED